MFELDVGFLVGLSLVVFVVSVVNGVAGLGFSLIGVAAPATVLQPRLAIAIMSVTSALLQPFQLRYHWAYRGVSGRLIPMLVASAIGTVAGSSLLVVVPAFVVAFGLGIFSLAYVLSTLRGTQMRVTPSTEREVVPKSVEVRRWSAT